MALRVWLPLNGTLENKGASNINIVNENATINTAGKIGSCYSFNGSGYRIHLSGDDLFKCIKGGNQPFSIAMWVFHEDSRRAILFGDYNSTGAINVNIELTTGHIVRFYWNGNPDYNTGVNIGASVWSHLTITYDGNKLCTYLNGALAATNNITLSEKNKTSGEFFLGRDYRTSETALKGRLNDFRVYDHCLSAAEVREISQGLVLHYKLDSFQGGYGNKNLLAKYVVPGQAGPTSVANGGRTTWLGDYKITIPATENADTYFRLFMTEQLTSGTTYTISCKVSGLLSGSYYRFPLFAQSNTSMGVLNLDHNGLCSLTFTMNWTGTQTAATGANGETVYVNFLDDSARAIASGQGAITLYDFKLEKGSSATTWCPSDVSLTQIQDSSGYGHNGTILLGTTALTSNSARYSASMIFNGYQNPTIDTIDSSFISAMTNCTVTWWEYVTVTGNNLPIVGQDTSHYIGAGSTTTKLYHNNAGLTGKLYKNGTVETSSHTKNQALYSDSITYTQNQWTHFALSGANISSWTKFRLNNYSSTWPVNGYISDVRIYATALSADDILSLYHTAAKVDNLQKLHTFEVKETNNNLLAGRLWSNGYSQHNPSAGLFSNFNSNGEPQFTSNSTSAGSNYIPINPSGHTYIYDYTISVNAGNQFYIGFERYDANKTSRSNQACIYTYASKPSSDVVKQHFTGTVDLSTDGVNPCAFIALRILNGWSGTNSGVTGKATIHSISLREVGTKQQPKLTKQGQFIEEELKEEASMKLHKNGIIETNYLIER